MAPKRRVLFVLFEGLPRTVIDSQVLAHVREMSAQGDLAFEVWSFACERRLYRESRQRLAEAEALAGCPVRLFRGVWYPLPFSLLANALVTAYWLLRLRPEFDVVHARGDFTAAVWGWLRLARRFGLLWDCRGDGEAEFVADFPATTALRRLAKWYKVATIRWRVALAARLCDEALFVTDNLRRVLGKGLGKRPCHIIPCAASSRIFHFDPGLRQRTRQALGYGPQNQVFVYCGGMAAYQCFPETVALFRRLHQQAPSRRLLVVTPRLEAARPHLAGLPPDSFTLLSARHGEVNGYLNAADVAFLLRETNAINVVAAPTKFAEYCLTGLPVIVTEGVPDYHALAGRYGNLCRITAAGVSIPEIADRAALAERYAPLLSREAVVDQYRTIYAAVADRTGNTRS